MNFLVTNDDGINAIGIKILANALKKYGNVYVVAPDNHMSGASHSFKLTPISLVPTEILDGVIAYHSSGTPVDCVRIANAVLDVKFDIVFSGINNGLNVGTDILYSGTVGAAREAVVEGIAGVAISTDFDSFNIVEKELDDILKLIINNKLYSKDYVLNVNFPTKEHNKSLGILPSIQGVKTYETRFIKGENNIYSQNDAGIFLDTNEESDVFITKGGYISITPLKVLQTEEKVYIKLKNHLKSSS